MHVTRGSCPLTCPATLLLLPVQALLSGLALLALLGVAAAVPEPQVAPGNTK